VACSCIKGDFDFKINTLDVKTLEFVHLSTWQTEGNYTIPDEHEIYITAPDSDQPITLKVNPTGSTIITNSDLGVSSCIEDGIYCIQAKACKSCENGEWGDTEFTKTELIAPQMLCSITQLTAQGKTEFWGRMKEVKASAKLGLTERVKELYSSLDEDLSMESCDKCC